MASRVIGAPRPDRPPVRRAEPAPASSRVVGSTVLSRLEADVVWALSALAHPAGVREVSDLLGRQDDLARLGVLSCLNGLVQKGIVGRPVDAGAYRYRLSSPPAPRRAVAGRLAPE